MLCTELIFCNNPKANGKIQLGFCCVNQDDTNFSVGIQNCNILYIE